MSNPNSKKSLTDVLVHWFENFSYSFNCVKIGKIAKVNTSNQTVSVQILHKRITDSNMSKRELRDYPLLQDVPFVVLGGGQSYVSFPISVGDNCLLFFNDYEIDRWWETGENLPANFERRHDISDAFALIGVHSLVDLIQGYSQYVHLKYSANSSITVGEAIDITNSQTNVSGKLSVGDDANFAKDVSVTGDTSIGGDLSVSGDITGDKKATAELHSTNGATGTFTNVGGQTLTIVDGIIVNIS